MNLVVVPWMFEPASQLPARKLFVKTTINGKVLQNLFTGAENSSLPLSAPRSNRHANEGDVL